MNNTYLLEIGIENLSRINSSKIIESLKEQIVEGLGNELLTYTNISDYITSRRLVLVIEDIETKNSDISEEVKGPARNLAFDENGNKTKAMEGFLKNHGLAEGENIYYKSINEVEYVFANKKRLIKNKENILAEVSSKAIKAIDQNSYEDIFGEDLIFTKSILWIVAMLDTNIINLEIGKIKSSSATKGNKFVKNINIVLPSSTNFTSILKENYVLINSDDRTEIIQYDSEKLAREKGGKILFDEDLLKEISYIYEYPLPLIGKINEEYMDIPKEFVLVVLKNEAGIIPIVDDKKRVQPYFICFKDGIDDSDNKVLTEKENRISDMIKSLRDCYFEDISHPLDERVEQLKDVEYFNNLGSLYDKTIRVQELSSNLARYLKVGEETIENLKRAAFLSKADLITGAVKSYSELRGIAGKEYAIKSGENEIVSSTIFQQYMPSSEKDLIPDTTAGAILSIAEKIDNICGMFAITENTKELNRSFELINDSLRIVDILLGKKLELSITEMIDDALYIYVNTQNLVINYEKTREEILLFVNNNIKSYFSKYDLREDVLEAILNFSPTIIKVKERAEIVSEWVERDNFISIKNLFNRIKSLIDNDSIETELDFEVLTEDDIKLYDEIKAFEEIVNNIDNFDNYNELYESIITFSEFADKYLNNIRIFVDNEEIKNNRIYLLKKINNILISICNFSKIECN